MEKVGILTMHCVENNGSKLQTYATKKIFEKLGFKAVIIDYKYPNEYHQSRGKKYFLSEEYSIKTKVKYFFRHVRFIEQDILSEQLRLFDKFYLRNFTDKYLNPTSIRMNPPKCDIYCVGSDQVWNVDHMKGDTVFLLDFVEKGRKISFSSSITKSTLPCEFIDIYKQHLSSFTHISVREKSAVTLLSSFLRLPIINTLDPVLMFDKRWWMKKMFISKNNYKKYIYFNVLNYMSDVYSFAVDTLRELKSHDNSLMIISNRELPNDISDVIIRKDIGPLKFVDTIYNAKYVLTDSFHASAFSLNMDTTLVPIVRCKDNIDDTRIVDLLEILELDDIIVSSINPRLGAYQNYDYVKVQNILSKLRELSVSYLKNATN